MDRKLYRHAVILTLLQAFRNLVADRPRCPVLQIARQASTLDIQHRLSTHLAVGKHAPNMKLASFEAIVRALDSAGVRYLVAGGLAVNAHGFLRFTKDADLVIQLIPDNVLKTFSALKSLGFKPLVPVTAEQFADRTTREGWIRDKGMQVLQFWSDNHRETPIDVFVTEPFPFDQEFERALIKPLYGEIHVRFVSLRTLIAMKQAAGRDQDRVDIENLRTRISDAT